MSKGIGGHTRPNQGMTNIWLTPPEIVEALGPFDLDPCAAVGQPWSTAKFSYETGGLEKHWVGRVWLNPPYGPHTGVWLKKLADHNNGISIIFARTETEMFKRQVWLRAAALRFLYGRLHFYTPDGVRAKGNAGGPSVLVAYGYDNADRLRDCRIPGAFVDLRGGTRS